MKLKKMTLCAMLFFGVFPATTMAEMPTVKLTGKYRVVQVGESKFKAGLEMLGREQNNYASSLTAYALNQLVEKKGNQESTDLARKYIGLALHLSPKNRDAVVANIQLSKGIFPKKRKKPYNSATLSSLLFARAKHLKDSEGVANVLLARAFMSLSAELNPKNEDAVYEAAMLEQDHGKLDWGVFSGK